jgi:hypothetical protein
MSFAVDHGQLLKGLDYLKLSVFASALNNGTAEAAAAREQLMSHGEEFVRSNSGALESTHLGDLVKEVRQVMVHAPRSHESALRQLASQSENMAKRLLSPCIGSFAFIIGAMAVGLNDGSASAQTKLIGLYHDGQGYARQQAAKLGDVGYESPVSEDMDVLPTIEHLAAGSNMHDILRLAMLNQPTPQSSQVHDAVVRTQRVFSGD